VSELQLPSTETDVRRPPMAAMWSTRDGASNKRPWRAWMFVNSV